MDHDELRARVKIGIVIVLFIATAIVVTIALMKTPVEMHSPADWLP